MPATPSRIGFITKAYRETTAGPLSSVVSLYGNAARKTPDALPTYFDDIADADAMAEERLDLLGVQRSVITAQVDQIDAALDIDVTEVLPTVKVIDDEQDRDDAGIVVGFTIDMNTERSALVVWG